MPTRKETARNLEIRYLDDRAPKKNQEKIKHVLHIYRDNKNVLRHTAERVLMALYFPRAFGHVGNKRKDKTDKADDIYDEFVSKYEKSSAEKSPKINRDKEEARPKIMRNYELRVVLFTQARKQDPNKEPFQQDEAAEKSSKRDRVSTSEPSTRVCCSTGRENWGSKHPATKSSANRRAS